MKIINVVQGTPEWKLARVGIPSASSFDKIVDTKGNPSKQRQKYMYQLAGERITGKAEETYQNVAMLRGIDLESEARSFYEVLKGVNTQQVGFCTDDESKYGCSPDSLVGDDGLLEIKCPMITNQVANLLGNDFPVDYYQQGQGQLLVTGRKYCDFLSYYPGMKPLLVRMLPDANFQVKLKNELELFCAELETIVNKIK